MKRKIAWIAGLVVILAVARTAYPDPVLVDDPDHVALFTTQNVVDVLDRAAQRHADGADGDGDLDEDTVEPGVAGSNSPRPGRTLNAVRRRIVPA